MERDTMTVSSETIDTAEAEAAIEELFWIERTTCVHLHYAKPGCYACRVVRA